ncbi:family 16 glycosylhydrolase [Phenylobacterium soli]|nr:family 16 glycosylhydrolase [Phenylobacterium soli]
MTATLTFSDDFNNLSLWNGSGGTWSTTTHYVDPMGNGSSLPSNGEQEWYINANYGPTASVKPWTVNNGVLTLTAQKVDPSIAGYLGYNQSGLPAMGSYQYTSGLIETDHSFSQTYGYFEMKAQLPAGQGLWPAFWLMRTDGSWPPELDVMEALGKDTTTAYASVHTAQTGTHTSQGMAVNLGDFSSGYHTYAVDWEADKITFFYDNKQVYQVDTPADMHSPMYMIANLAIGGGWAGSADASTPAVSQMNIDYIKAWTSNPYADGQAAATAPTAATSPASGSTATASVVNGVASAPLEGGSLQGGDGADTLTGGANGSNRLMGGGGSDQITGGGYFDALNGNAGADTVHGGGGDDWVSGGRDDDFVFGDAGNDIANGNLGNDTVDGGPGDDTVRGGAGDDRLFGGDGNDHLWGDRGVNNLTGGAGADTFHTFAGAGVSYVSDFHQAEGDRIAVDGAAYTVSQSGADVLVDLGGGTQMILQNTQLTSLHDGWIF